MIREQRTAGNRIHRAARCSRNMANLTHTQALALTAATGDREGRIYGGDWRLSTALALQTRGLVAITSKVVRNERTRAGRLRIGCHCPPVHVWFATVTDAGREFAARLETEVAR